MDKKQAEKIIELLTSIDNRLSCIEMDVSSLQSDMDTVQGNVRHIEKAVSTKLIHAEDY